MRAHPDNRHRHPKRRHSLHGVAAVCILLGIVIGGPFLWPMPKQAVHTGISATSTLHRPLDEHAGPALPAFFGATAATAANGGRIGNAQPAATAGSAGGIQTTNGAPLSFSHTNVVTTWFWVGEPADADNDYISNSPSAWDSQWQAHYGGPDAPTGRNGYYPGGLTPHENPFYVALPYNDIADSGKRKSTASSCPLKNSTAKYSWCKNAWVAVRHNGKVVYAQWEDVGPNNEDDFSYVFGTTAPTNTFGAHAGLDVSPAVRDYLGLGDVGKADWTFVTASSVPSGPWRNIVTTSLGDNTVN